MFCVKVRFFSTSFADLARYKRLIFDLIRIREVVIRYGDVALFSKISGSSGTGIHSLFTLNGVRCSGFMSD